MRRAIIISAFAAAAACGGEETLTTVKPQISICPRADAPAAECDQAIALGTLGIDFAHKKQAFAVNRGDGVLTVKTLTALDPTITATATLPLLVAPGGSQPISLTITPAMLGPGSSSFEVTSDDATRGKLTVELSYEGTPKPVPKILLCTTGCATDVAVDFGVVRQTREASETVTVRNVGEAPLSINDVRWEGTTSAPGEVAIATSTRSGVIAPGESAPLVVVYSPKDAIADELAIAIASDDPTAPTARVTVRGSGADNAPPIAVARDAATSTTSLTVVVGEVVAIDGRASSDPEGDPLAFSWSLMGPMGTASTFDDPAAGLVTFVPDAAGDYTIVLEVADSLDQRATATVTVHAMFRYALRASIVWAAGGDVDLHLAPSASMIFSTRDCSFENRSPDLGVAGDSRDDPRLVSDATAAGSSEEIVLAAPAAGTYRVWAHYYDDGGAGPAEVTARITFDDSGTPAAEVTRTLDARCDLWQIGDITFPQRTFTANAAPNSQLCR